MYYRYFIKGLLKTVKWTNYNRANVLCIKRMIITEAYTLITISSIIFALFLIYFYVENDDESKKSESESLSPSYSNDFYNNPCDNYRIQNLRQRPIIGANNLPRPFQTTQPSNLKLFEFNAGTFQIRNSNGNNDIIELKNTEEIPEKLQVQNENDRHNLNSIYGSHRVSSNGINNLTSAVNPPHEKLMSEIVIKNVDEITVYHHNYEGDCNLKDDTYKLTNENENIANEANKINRSLTKPTQRGLRGSKPLVAAVRPLDNVAGFTRISSAPSSNVATVTTTSLPVNDASTSKVAGDNEVQSTAVTTSQSLSLEDLHLTQVLGGGAFGQVWRGSWNGTPVAVKVLSNTCSTVLLSSSLTAFESEVKMLASLRHPNICLYMGANMKPPNMLIVTELVSRGSLWEVLRTPSLFQDHNGPLYWPWWLIRRVVEDSCRGLVYLHSLHPPILHRDLKSANLLLDDSFHAKICDFGLARLRTPPRLPSGIAGNEYDGDAKDNNNNNNNNIMDTIMTAQVGTLQWMAPEVMTGISYGESADIYSLSVVIWEVLTGQCPFEGLGPIQLVTAVTGGIRPEIPTHTPEKLKDCIQVCWDPEPLKRMSALQLLEAIPSLFG